MTHSAQDEEAVARAEPALLSLSDFSLDAFALSADRIQTSGKSLCLAGEAQPLLSAFVSGASYTGQLLILGRDPAEALRAGLAGYAPQEIPFSSNINLLDALLISGQLIGANKRDVMDALERCHLSGLKRTKLGGLSRLQKRLTGLAHALICSPELLILEDLTVDLDEDESDVLESVLFEELSSRPFLLASGLTTSLGRRLMMMADEVLCAAGGRIMPPQHPATLSADAHWVVCFDDAAALFQHMTRSGVRVTRSPKDRVLLVQGATGSQILKWAAEVGATVAQISPLLRQRISPAPMLEAPE